LKAALALTPAWLAVLLNKINGLAGKSFVFGGHGYMPGIREGDKPFGLLVKSG